MRLVNKEDKMKKRKYVLSTKTKANKIADKYIKEEIPLTINNSSITVIKNILKTKHNEQIEKNWWVKRKRYKRKRRVDPRLKWVWSNSVLKSKENKEKKKQKEQRKKEENN